MASDGAGGAVPASAPSSTAADDLATARRLKEEGNELFKQGAFQPALAKYTKVFLYTNYIDNAMALQVHAMMVSGEELCAPPRCPLRE